MKTDASPRHETESNPVYLTALKSESVMLITTLISAILSVEPANKELILRIGSYRVCARLALLPANCGMIFLQ
jgi:hypothetical protein